MAHRVLVHVDEGGDKPQSVVQNVENLLDDVEDAQIELVAHGPGIAALERDGELSERVEALGRRGVRLAACGNTMSAQELGPGDLVEGAEVVPSGVGELVRREAEGWLYVRP